MLAAISAERRRPTGSPHPAIHYKRFLMSRLLKPFRKRWWFGNMLWMPIKEVPWRNSSKLATLTEKNHTVWCRSWTVRRVLKLCDITLGDQPCNIVCLWQWLSHYMFDGTNNTDEDPGPETFGVVISRFRCSVRIVRSVCLYEDDATRDDSGADVMEAPTKAPTKDVTGAPPKTPCPDCAGAVNCLSNIIMTPLFWCPLHVFCVVNYWRNSPAPRNSFVTTNM